MNILITQTASLGDVILSTPIVAALKRAFPDAKLNFLATSAGSQLLKLDPRLSSVLSFDKKGRDSGIFAILRKASELQKHKFDLAIAIQRSARVSILLKLSKIKKRVGFSSSALPFLFTDLVPRVKNLHEVERNLSILANTAEVEDRDKDLKLFAPRIDEIKSELKDVLQAVLGSYVAIFPGSLWYTKRWDPLNFISIARKIKSSGREVFFFGSPDEKKLVDYCANEANCNSFAGKTSLQDLLCVVENAKLVVCNDSSSLHMAAAFKVPNVAVFCATTPEMGFSPWRNPNARVLEEKELWCRPCSRHGGVFCPTGTEACMKGIDSTKGAGAENVFSAIKEFL